MESASGPAVPFAAEKRAEAVRLAALGFGSRAGLARRGWEIGAILDRQPRARAAYHARGSALVRGERNPDGACAASAHGGDFEGSATSFAYSC